MNRATTAEWVKEKMEAIFRRYPKPQVDRAYPVLLLLMARDFGLENLEAPLAERVLTLLHNIGIHEGMAEGEVKFRITRFVTALEINEQILVELKEVFDEHYSSLGETSAKKFIRRVLRRNTRFSPNSEVPENVKGTIRGEELARQLKRPIRC